MGVNIAKLVRGALKSQGKTLGLRTATLLRSVSGARDPSSPSAGTQPTTTSYSCEALIEVATVANVPATLVQENDRKIGILGDSIAVVPTVQDRITIEDIDGVQRTYRLVAPVTGDGVGAMYEFVARK